MELVIKGVKKSFKDKVVLDNVNLEAKGSDIIGIVGRSGCGKSTLLKILVGYHKPDSGEILLNQKSISTDMRALRRIVGYTTQENSFYEKLTVIENMRYYSALYGIKKSSKRIHSLLAQVGLLEHRNSMAENLSGGMKRRLDFAISLLHNPDILILDEPASGLDPMLTDQFWAIVKKVVSQEGKIVITSSHILSDVEKYCTKAAVLDKGHVIKIFSQPRISGLEEKFRELLK